MSLTVLSRSRAFLRDGAYVTDPVLIDGAATYTPGVSERRGAATTFDQASDEANQYRDYKKTVEQAMAAGFDELQGQRLIKDNNPGVGGPFRVIQKFWELLIDAT